MKKFISLLTKTAAVIGISAALSCTAAGAEWVHDRYLGDVNNDGEITVADLVGLSRHVLGEEFLGESSVAAYREDVRTGMKPPEDTPNFPPDQDFGISIDTAHITDDGDIDAFDVVRMRQMLLDDSDRISIFRWEEPQPVESDFIDPPIYDLYGSLPSQGTAEMAVFYVDFPDCRFDYTPGIDGVREAVFGDINENSPAYPFESMNAFFKRSSKGAVELDGQVYTYTTKNPKYYYENDVWHVALVDELIAAFDGQVDFSQFDGDNDRTIDAILISVPNKAGDDNWWPAAGIFGGERYNRADGMNVGHVIVGNAEIKNEKDGQSNFVSSYCHESGHCMGLSDYYLYNAEDFQGMHGSAGFELMDDAICDLGAASKLMLGWYREDQIAVYDRSSGSASFDLYDAQSDRGNCVIIPAVDLGDKYRAEFFIIEYATMNGNNADLSKEWWRSTGSGVRVYHISAEVTGDPWFNSWMFASGNDEYTNYNKGRRFIRLVGEGDDYTDNFFRTGDVINGSTSGFRWYDWNDELTIDPKISISVGEFDGEKYGITIKTAG